MNFINSGVGSGGAGFNYRETAQRSGRDGEIDVFEAVHAV